MLIMRILLSKIFKTVLLCMAVLLLFCSSCSQDDNRAVILIKNTGLTYPVRLYRIDTTGFVIIDSLTKPAEREFKFIVAVNQLTAFNISSQEHQTSFFLQAGDTVTVDLTKEGGIQNEQPEFTAFSEFLVTRQLLEKEADSLASLYISAQVTDSFAIVREKVNNEFNNLISETRSLSTSYILRNPESLGIYLALNFTLRQYQVFDYSVSPEIFLFADSVLQKYHPGNQYSIRTHNIVSQLQRKFGRPGKSPVRIEKGDIIQIDPFPGLNNKPVRILIDKDEIAIIYLWDESISSRKSTPTIKKLHEEFKERGLDIYAVSFTSSRRTWTSLIELDKMWWNNMIDTTASRSELLQRYNVKRLPYFIVIDHKSKVLSRFANAIALEEWIRLYFNDNK